jgi:predicted ATPase
MIERIRIKNFRCLADCEIKFKRVSLLLGENGSGKSSVFDVLMKIRRFLTKPISVSNAFRRHDLTRFSNSSEQEFELQLRTGTGVWRYFLKLKHEPNADRSRMLQERLTVNEQSVVHFENREAHIYGSAGVPDQSYRDDGKYSWVQRWDHWWIPTPLEKPETFFSCIGRILQQRPCAPTIRSDSREADSLLSPVGRNFVSWYRDRLEKGVLNPKLLFGPLKETIDGFASIRLEGATRGTQTMFVDIRPDANSDPIPYRLSELSDGQRQLILLYTVLYGVPNKGWILLLDEPDNFLSLREIQPWLTSLFDATGPTLGQSIIVSHHPEVIDYLAAENAIWFTRDNAGPTRVTFEPPDSKALLRPSELLARGWK